MVVHDGNLHRVPLGELLEVWVAARWLLKSWTSPHPDPRVNELADELFRVVTGSDSNG